MIEVAKLFENIEEDKISHIVKYYNNNCMKLVKPSRQYLMTNNDSWCAMFVSVVAHIKGLPWFPYEVSANEQKELCSNLGRFRVNYKPQVNDLVFYDFNKSGWVSHVGIVESVQGDSIRVIEGNKSNAVSYRTLNYKDEVVTGYGVLWDIV